MRPEWNAGTYKVQLQRDGGLYDLAADSVDGSHTGYDNEVVILKLDAKSAQSIANTLNDAYGPDDGTWSSVPAGGTGQ